MQCLPSSYPPWMNIVIQQRLYIQNIACHSVRTTTVKILSRETVINNIRDFLKLAERKIVLWLHFETLKSIPWKAQVGFHVKLKTGSILCSAKLKNNLFFRMLQFDQFLKYIIFYRWLVRRGRVLYIYDRKHYVLGKSSWWRGPTTIMDEEIYTAQRSYAAVNNWERYVKQRYHSQGPIAIQLFLCKGLLLLFQTEIRNKKFIFIIALSSVTQNNFTV